MSEPNPFVAQPSGTGPSDWSGVWIVEDVQALVAAIGERSWVDATLAGVGAGLDALALVSDPLGSLLQYGVAWIIEHVRPLTEVLDWLAGDPAAVAAFAQTWRNVAQGARDAADELARVVAADASGWGGSAGPAYRAWAHGQAEALGGLATAAQGVALATEAAGILVAGVRELVRDAIALLVSRLCVYAAEELASFGFATPLVVEQVVTTTAAFAARIARWVRALVRSLEALLPLLRRLADVVRQLARRLRRPHGEPGGPREPGEPGEPGREGGGPGDPVAEPPYRSPAPGTPEYEARREELSHDPAHLGRVSPKSVREAEVGLALEARGDLPGPITRTPLDDSDPAAVKDLGDFTDATGQRWEVKNPTDIFPAGRNKGQPMPEGLDGRYDGPTWDGIITKELAKGQWVALDHRDLSPESLADLRARVASHPEWAGKVVFYP